MNDIFRPFLGKFVMVVIDEILIYSKLWHEHLSHFCKVFKILQQHQLYLKKSKCSFGQNSVEYLGKITNLPSYVHHMQVT